MFLGAINIVSAFALMGEAGENITPSKPTAVNKHQAAVRWKNKHKPIFPAYFNSWQSRGVPSMEEERTRQIPNLGLKGTLVALLGLAGSVGAAVQCFHRPGTPAGPGERPRTPLLGLQGCVSSLGVAPLFWPPKTGQGPGLNSGCGVTFGTGWI